MSPITRLTRVVKQLHQQIGDPLQPDRLDASRVQNVQNRADLTTDQPVAFPIEIQNPLEIASELLVPLSEEVQAQDSRGKSRGHELFAGEHEKLRPVQHGGGKTATQPNTRPNTASDSEQFTDQSKSLQVTHEQALREIRIWNQWLSDWRSSAASTLSLPSQASGLLNKPCRRPRSLLVSTVSDKRGARRGA
jgi:hypothetical protein